MSDTIKIPLTRGYTAIVDSADSDLAEFKWYTNNSARKSPYAHRQPVNGDGKRSSELMHRVILERKLGRKLNPKSHVDHISGDTLDNRRCNLREATTAQNIRNQKLRIDNTTGYKGVNKKKGLEVWNSRIVVDREFIHLGYYRTDVEAAIAYNHAAKHHFGEFARFNDIAGWEHIFPERLSNAAKSGYKGVTEASGLWKARINLDGKTRTIGYFTTPEEAHEAYKKAAQERDKKATKAKKVFESAPELANPSRYSNLIIETQKRLRGWTQPAPAHEDKAA